MATRSLSDSHKQPCPPSPLCRSDEETVWKASVHFQSNEDDEHLDRINGKPTLSKLPSVSIGCNISKNKKRSTPVLYDDDSSTSSVNMTKCVRRPSKQKTTLMKQRIGDSDSESGDSQFKIGQRKQHGLEEKSDEDSVDTTELACRLKRNLGSTYDQLAQTAISDEIVTKSSPDTLHSHKLSCILASKFEIKRNSITSVEATAIGQKNFKSALEDSDCQDEHSEGDQSVDTVELTRRLRANLGTTKSDAPTNNPPKQESPKVSRKLPGQDQGPHGESASSLQSCFQGVLSDNEEEEYSDVERSEDTVELTRRLHANFGPKNRCSNVSTSNEIEIRKFPLNSITSLSHPRNLSTCQMNIASVSDRDTDRGGDNSVVATENNVYRAEINHQRHSNMCPLTTTEISQGLPAAGDQPTNEILQFRLPSQSESSSDDDSETHDDHEMNTCDTDERENSFGIPFEKTCHDPIHPTVATVETSVRKSVNPPLVSLRRSAPVDVPKKAPSETNVVISSPSTKVAAKLCHHSHQPLQSASPSLQGRRQIDCQAWRPSVSQTKRNKLQNTTVQDLLVTPELSITRTKQSVSRQDQNNFFSHQNRRHDDLTGGCDSYPVSSPELYVAAFGAPGSLDRLACDHYVQSCSPVVRPATMDGVNLATDSATSKRVGYPLCSEAKTDDDLFDEVFVGSDKYHKGPKSSGDKDCILLLDSDSDGGEGNHPGIQTKQMSLQPPNIHSGLRTVQKSPRFNIASRAFPKRRLAAVIDPDAIALDDISEDDWDWDETYRPSQKVARRVTEDQTMRIRQHRPRRVGTTENPPTNAISSGALSAAADQAEHESFVGLSGLARPWRRNQKPRIRDATASNPFNAASVASVRNPQQQYLPFPTGPERFGTLSIVQQRQNLQKQRNDIHGGSGVGVAGFTFRDNGSHAREEKASDDMDDNEYDERRAIPTRRPSQKSTIKNGAASRKKVRSGGAIKTKKGAGGRGGGSTRGRARGRGTRGRSSRGGRQASGDVWEDGNKGGWKVSEAFTREDPAMQHIGGAEISF